MEINFDICYPVVRVPVGWHPHLRRDSFGSEGVVETTIFPFSGLQVEPVVEV